VTYLFDTHVLLWALGEPEHLTPEVRELVDQGAVGRSFSVASVWEIVIKSAQRRVDFNADAASVRNALLDSGFREIDITADHVLALRSLPRLHGDPFDRIMIAQANAEGLTFVTADAMLAKYPVRVLVF
jgi:PIN domain nuclease of toxin-antitoxin system